MDWIILGGLVMGALITFQAAATIQDLRSRITYLEHELHERKLRVGKMAERN